MSQFAPHIREGVQIVSDGLFFLAAGEFLRLILADFFEQSAGLFDLAALTFDAGAEQAGRQAVLVHGLSQVRQVLCPVE